MKSMGAGKVEARNLALALKGPASPLYGQGPLGGLTPSMLAVSGSILGWNRIRGHSR